MTECPVLLITLLSSAGSQTSKGFILEYEARETTGSTKISPTSRQQITNADTGHIRYPGNGQNYTNSEVSTFIFTPRDNFYQAKKNTTVTFVEDWMDDVHCYDEIHVFHLVDSSAGGKFYDWASAVCPGTDMKVLSNHDDIIIAVFMTDEKNRTGFHLIHSRVHGRKC
ncbi:hypothetical protein Ocin01_12171 [Orchesella cincta]|uniref:CUB domain-containing protein n=1 Tax=Orchesella cincta TaxID=48709 RepID=A0A1D2MN58_ORCCI|nr:hypothetical protein Ocin01_12171 [Orchesella cincta]